MAWTLTRHLMAPYQVQDNGIAWDAYHQWLIVSCEQIVDTDPLFLMINPDDFTDITSFHSSAVGHTWVVFEFVFSLYDNSIYMLATKSGFAGSKYLVRYNLGGVWQFETVLYYTLLRENPTNNDLWVSDLTGGFYTNKIFKISRVDGSVLTTYDVGRAPSFTIFDSAGNFYFTSTSGPLSDKTLFKVDLSTGTVTSLLTHASTLTDLVYNPTTNRLWVCTNSALWVEYDIAGNALTGASITMPATTRFGLNYLDPNTTDAIWGTRYFDPQRICAQSLSDATVADFTVPDGLTAPGSGTFASPRQDFSGDDPVLVYGERLCFYALDLNEDTFYYDIQEACPPAGGVVAMPDAEYNWPNPPGPRGIHAALRFMSYGLFPPIPLVVPPATLAPRPSGVSHSVINWQELVASTHPDSKEIAYEFAPDRDRHSSHDFDDTGVYSGIYRPEEP